MMRPLTFLALFSFGCASVPSGPRLPAADSEASAPSAKLYVPSKAAEAPVVSSAPPADDAQAPADESDVDSRIALYLATPLPSWADSAAAEDESLRKNRFTLKGGYYTAEDSDELDDGYIINGAWTRFFSRFFAVEVELGYLDVDGEDSGIEADVWGVPLMLNGRANLPITIFDLYAGLGVGTIYYDVEIDTIAGDTSDEGFALGGNAFLGASINLADRFAIGLEAKYYVTEEVDDLDASLDAFALLLTIGFSR
jgi:hypothetical protein